MAKKYSKKFIGIEVGDTFSSYDELKRRILKVQEDSRMPLLLRDCVTLRGAVKRRPNIAILANPALEYHSLHYICVCGRRDAHRTQTYIRLGISPEYLSPENEKCPSEIKVGLTKDYQELEVKKIVNVHNHKISQKLYKIISLSKISSVSNGSECEAGAIKSYSELDYETPKRNDDNDKELLENEDCDDDELSSDEFEPELDLTRHGSSESQKRRRSSDDNSELTVKRIRQTDPAVEVGKQKNSNKGKRIAFKHLQEEMYSVKGANCEVYEDGMKPLALYFQTKEMKECFEAYPEVLLIDSSYTISQLKMKVYTLLNADGNGQCTVVGFCFAMKDDAKVISFLLGTFVRFNPQCHETKSIVLDHPTYIAHLNTTISHFTSATLSMCYHFSVRAYETKIQQSRTLPFQNPHEKDMCAGLFKQMALSKDEKSYYECYQRFKLYSPDALFKYFLINWHRRKEEWVDCMKDSNSWFLDQRHCGIENIERRLTKLCNNYASMKKFFSGLQNMMSSLRLERKQKALEVPVKGPIITPPFRMAEIQYQNFLSPYAFSLVRKQIQSSPTVRILDNDDSEQCTVVSPKYGKIICTPTSCPCMVFTVIGLPCCHVFAVRSEKWKHGFDKSLCKPRWSLRRLREILQLKVEDTGLVQDVNFGVPVLPEYIEECENTDQNPQDSSRSSNKELENVPFVPTCVQPQVSVREKDNDDDPAEDCIEEIVIDEVDPDGDFALFGTVGSSAVEADEVLDWADMLETL